MKKYDWLDGFKEEIIELYYSGLKQIEIAKKFDVSQTAISTRLRKWKASNPDGNRFIRYNIDKEDLRRMYWDEKMHPSQIAEKYGCHKQIITNRLHEYGIPTRTKSEARMGELNPIYGVGHTKETRQKMSEAFTIGNRTIGFNSHWGKGAYYETPNQGKVWMRSGWEVKVADYLTENGYDWYYEIERLYLDEISSYLPDFYLPEYDIYIEVKGRIDKYFLDKFKKVKEQYNVILLDAEALLKLKIIDCTSSGRTKLNRKYKNYTKKETIFTV